MLEAELDEIGTRLKAKAERLDLSTVDLTIDYPAVWTASGIRFRDTDYLFSRGTSGEWVREPF